MTDESVDNQPPSTERDSSATESAKESQAFTEENEIAASAQEEAQTGFTRGISGLYGSESAPPLTPFDIDVLIITALPKEFAPLIEALDARPCTPRSDEPDSAYSAIFRHDRDGSYRVRCISLDAMGGEGATRAAQAIRTWRPSCVLLVGIAAANRSHESLELGDLLIATTVVDATRVKVEHSPRVASGERGTVERILRPESLPCDRQLVRQMCDFARRNWPGAVHAGAFVSSNVLIKDDSFRDEIAASHHRSIGFEMEGHGIANAVAEISHRSRPAFGLVKAAVDWADHEKDDSYQAKGAASAAAFIADFLRSGPFPSINLRPRVSENKHQDSLRSLAVHPEELRRCTQTLVLSSEAEQQLRSAKRPIALISGPVGSGRRSAALALLAARHQSILRVEDINGLTTARLEADTGYLLEIDGELELTEFDVSPLGERLASLSSTLALVVGRADGSAGDSDQVDLITSIEMGDPFEILTNHLRYRASADDELSRAIDLLAQNEDSIEQAMHSPSLISRLAEQAITAVRSNEDTPLAAFLETPAATWARAKTIDDSVLLLTASCLGGASPGLIDEHSAGLRRLLIPDDESPQSMNPFAEADSTRDNRLALKRRTLLRRRLGIEMLTEALDFLVPSSGTGVLEHVWEAFASTQEPLQTWLLTLIFEADWATSVRAARALGIVSSFDPSDFFNESITAWAQGTDHRLRFHAAVCLSTLVVTPRSANYAREKIKRLAKSKIEESQATATIAGFLTTFEGDFSLNTEIYLDVGPERPIIADRYVRFGLLDGLALANSKPPTAAYLLDAVAQRSSVVLPDERTYLLQLLVDALEELEAPDRGSNSRKGALVVGKTDSHDLIRSASQAMTLLLENPTTARQAGRVCKAWAHEANERGAESPAHLILELLRQSEVDVVRASVEVELKSMRADLDRDRFEAIAVVIRDAPF